MSAGFVAYGQQGGDRMAYSRQGGLPWHGLGTALEGHASSKEMIDAIQADWQVECHRLFVDIGGQRKEAPAFGTVRMDTQDILGVVGERYTPIQNSDVFAFMDDLVGQDAAVWETAGTLHGGKKLWASAVLPEEEIIYRREKEVQDVSKRYWLLCNSHDGSMALKAYFTEVRVVCQNTLTASAYKATNRISIRHTVNYEDRINSAKKMMDWTTKYYEAMQEQKQFLADTSVAFEDLVTFLEDLWPDTVAENSQAYKKREAAMRNSVEEIKRYGADWLSALNGVTGFVDHTETPALPDGSRNEARMEKLLFGSGANLKEKAFMEALDRSGYFRKNG